MPYETGSIPHFTDEQLELIIAAHGNDELIFQQLITGASFNEKGEEIIELLLKAAELYFHGSYEFIIPEVTPITDEILADDEEESSDEL